MVRHLLLTGTDFAANNYLQKIPVNYKIAWHAGLDPKMTT